MKQAEEAKAEQAKAQQQLEAAKKNADAAGTHVAEIEKQIKEAEAAAGGKPAAEAAKPQAAAKPAPPAAQAAAPPAAAKPVKAAAEAKK